MPKVDTRKAVAPMSGDEEGLSIIRILEPIRAGNKPSCDDLKFHNHREALAGASSMIVKPQTSRRFSL